VVIEKLRRRSEHHRWQMGALKQAPTRSTMLPESQNIDHLPVLITDRNGNILTEGNLSLISQLFSP
jgi:hypothetical protein